MELAARPSGLVPLGDVPWGTHLCHFYGPRADLVEAVVPFLHAGLSANEQCVWITGELCPSEEARGLLRAELPDLDRRLADGQLEVLDGEAWYDGARAAGAADCVIPAALEREREALRRGFSGLRIASVTAWRGEREWEDVAHCEARLDRALRERRALVLCSYALTRCGAAEIVDVVRNHGLALVRRGGRWEIIQSATSLLATPLPSAAAPPAAAEAASRRAGRRHDVQFYADRRFLAARVAEFVREGLTGGEGVLLLAAGSNTAAILRALARLGAEPARQLAAGRLLVGDARELLAEIRAEGRPDHARFMRVVGELVRRARARQGRIRVYGELVDVLTSEGDEDGALAVEESWNALLAEEPFPLLCGYQLDGWASAAGADGFRRVCAAHDGVSPAEGDDALRAVSDPNRILAELQQKARALSLEARRRQDLEGERRRLHEAEQAARAQAEEATRHLALLQRVTSALSQALAPEDVARVVGTAAAAAVGADRAVLALPSESATGLRVLPRTGDAPPEVAIDAPLPLVAAYHGRLVWLPTPEAIEAEFPGAAEPGTAAVACLPLALGQHPLGALAFAFREAQAFTPTRRALLEDLARQASLVLERALLFQTAEQERQRAEAANRAKDDFLATLSHELRTPLTSILGWARVLRSGGLDERGAERALTTIERNARAQAQLIDDLLDLSRIATGKMRLDVRLVDLGEVVQATMDVVRPAAEAKGVHLGADVDPAARPLLADPDRLQQILWNLLSNAVRFTQSGGQVTTSVRRAEGGVEIRVRDTGRGIHPELLPFVFERFRQADGSSRRSHGGLGLGLAIVRYLVELHGGTVAAESGGEGRGATFTVVLPVAGPARALSAGPLEDTRPGPDGQPELPVSLAGLRVLLVEDEADARDLLQAVLTRAGAAVTGVPSTGEALLALDRTAFDVLIADIGLPAADGYSLLHAVRQLPPERGGRLPALALTAYAGPQHRRRALVAGFQAYLAKPVDPAELVALVANLGRVAAGTR